MTILIAVLVLVGIYALSRSRKDISDIKENVEDIKRENTIDHEYLAKELLRHREMILCQEEINRQQAIINRKNTAKFRKLEAAVDQANDDIDFCKDQMREWMRYGEFLRKERDKCTPGGKEWYKWNNKITENNNKVHSFQKRMNVAVITRDKAQEEMEVA